MRPIAIITGATSGIGKAFAEALAQKGYDLVLTGRRQSLLLDVGEHLGRTYGVETTCCIVDFSKEEAFKSFLEYIETLDHVEFLINNAGYGAEASFTTDTLTNQIDMMKVHLLASTKLVHTVVQPMKKREKGTIINVSSLAGTLALPNSAMYCSTKAFLTNFSESLAMELKPFNIRVQALCPGFVHTDFHSKLNMESSKLKSRGFVRWMQPEAVVTSSLRALEKEWQVIVIPGKCNKMLPYFKALVPKKTYYRLVSKWGNHKNF